MEKTILIASGYPTTSTCTHNLCFIWEDRSFCKFLTTVPTKLRSIARCWCERIWHNVWSWFNPYCKLVFRQCKKEDCNLMNMRQLHILFNYVKTCLLISLWFLCFYLFLPVFAWCDHKIETFLRGHSITTWTRWEGEGVKKCLFLSTLRVWKLSMQGGGGWGWGQKMTKFCPHSCWIKGDLK